MVVDAKNMPKSLRYTKKQYLCTAFEQKTGLWCNGNTADSGPAFPGSSPGSPAQEKRRKCASSLFLCRATRTRTGKAGHGQSPCLFSLFLICSANGAPSGRSRSHTRFAPIRLYLRIILATRGRGGDIPSCGGRR